MSVTVLKVSNDHLVTVELKTVYGIDKVYPSCARAKIFADIAGTKTFSSANIERMRDLGFRVVERYGRSIWPTH